ncbi:MAG: ATP-binding protein, partial [Armatimonadetes bacterium]|nr:ATP-binding protein [Armatimonadota bacterium]
MGARFFNNAGPSEPAQHYCIDPLRRIRVDELERLIDAQRYFVLHAPRQTGKTTCLITLMRQLNAAGKYRCAYANIEDAQAARGKVDMGLPIVVDAIASGAQWMSGDPYPASVVRDIQGTIPPGAMLRTLLTRWSQADPRPLALFIDEIDALVGDTLISVLRQLRGGYPQRPAAFPQSVILCGVRDVRDYRIHSSDGEIITGGSAFNIKAESLVLGDLTEAEVGELLQQHTDETGQLWTGEAVDEIWRLTQGQPWLVNAIAYELTSRRPEGRDRSRELDLAMVTAAREELILRRDVHIDQLADKLKEPRVRRVVE